MRRLLLKQALVMGIALCPSLGWSCIVCEQTVCVSRERDGGKRCRADHNGCRAILTCSVQGFPQPKPPIVAMTISTWTLEFDVGASTAVVSGGPFEQLRSNLAAAYGLSADQLHLRTAVFEAGFQDDGAASEAFLRGRNAFFYSWEEGGAGLDVSVSTVADVLGPVTGVAVTTLQDGNALVVPTVLGEQPSLVVFHARILSDQEYQAQAETLQADLWDDLALHRELPAYDLITVAMPAVWY